MKKIYASLAVAVAVSAQAFAGVDATKATLTTMSTDIERGTGFAPVEKAEGPMKAPATVANGNQSFKYDYYSMRSDASGLQESSLYVEINGTDVTIYGLFDLAPVKGTFNAAAGTIRVAPQAIFYKYGNENIWLYTKKLVFDDQGYVTSNPEVPYIEFMYMPEGAQLQNGNVVCVGGWMASDDMEFAFTVPSMKDTNSGFNWMYMMRLSTIEEAYDFPFFQYDASEWADCSNASLEDGWFKALDGVGFPAYNVACKKNIANPNEILLVNPYGTNTPYASKNSTAGKEGYILLNIEDPDCVLVQPYTNCQMNLSMWYEIDALANPIFATSKEGWLYYVEGWTIDEIKEDAEAFGDPMSTMTEDGVVTIVNARVQGDGGVYTAAQQWEAEGGIPIEMISTIKLPADALGINGVINDATDAPARYFNLQGIEIANPEAGEVVIVKKGNETFKTIAK